MGDIFKIELAPMVVEPLDFELARSHCKETEIRRGDIFRDAEEPLSMEGIRRCPDVRKDLIDWLRAIETDETD